MRAVWGDYLPDWQPWEDHRQGYAARRAMGGGTILTLIHAIDVLYWFFGSARPNRTTSLGASNGWTGQVMWRPRLSYPRLEATHRGQVSLRRE